MNLGTLAPTFPQLKAQRGKTVVLYFYPKDNTSGCTVEACELRDAHKQITAKMPSSSVSARIRQNPMPS